MPSNRKVLSFSAKTKGNSIARSQLGGVCGQKMVYVVSSASYRHKGNELRNPCNKKNSREFEELSYTRNDASPHH